MIDVKQAVKIAVDYAKDILSGEKIDQITLEEVELAQAEPFWYVTLGISKIVQVNPFEVLTGKGAHLQTKYKIFKIHRDSGEVYSMKIRKE